MNTLRLAPLLLILLTLPGAAYAANDASEPYQFARQGVFGCSLTGSYAMSVGAMSAVGGVYVPVNDAAVTLNTGYLVYKECVLRGIVNRERESALAANTQQVITSTLTGRDGNPIFWQSRDQDNVPVADDKNVYYMQNRLSSLNEAFRQAVIRAQAQNYLAQSRRAEDVFTCPYPGDMRLVWSGQDTSAAAMAALRDSRCNPTFASDAAEKARNAFVGRDQAELMWRLTVNNGFYDVSTVDANNQRVVLTPGIVRQGVLDQAVTSGWRQTENANDVDQMIGALFSGLGTHILSSTQGLSGLTQRIGSQPSYLSQVAAESAAGLRNSAANAGIQILNAALQVERTYNQIVNSIANHLTATITQLRATENQCWNLIISKVCVASPGPDGRCQYQPPCTNTTTTAGTNPFTGQPNSSDTQQVCPPTITLKVSTSTEFSSQVIDSQITPLANQTLTNINNSENALTLINRLVAGVTNTTSVNAQRVALAELDQLVSQNALHNQTQLTTLQNQQAAIRDTMSTLFNDTKVAWADSEDRSIGWCNVNNPAVIQMWVERWRQ